MQLTALTVPQRHGLSRESLARSFIGVWRKNSHDTPYSIFIWQPAHTPTGQGAWIEPVQVSTQEYALYVANLIHQNTRSVMKVLCYGLTIACYPNAHAGELVERQIVRQRRVQ